MGKTILETERLILREMTDEDFPALQKVISDPENMKPSNHPGYDEKGVWRWINWCKDCYQKYGFGLWAVTLRESGEMIGDCGVSMQFIDDEWKPEIGYHLRLDQHLKGYGKEMTRAVKDYFFTHFDYDEVYSYMDKDNLPSYKTAEANGMKYLHLYTTKDGQVCRVYRITRQEWKDTPSPLEVNGVPYHVIRLLGKGKGGYSFWAERDGKHVVLKQIHHEPCSYYSFGDKIAAERHDYERLKSAGIRIPEMFDIDEKTERIVKEYVAGETIFDLVAKGESVEPYLPQVREMAAQAKQAGLNIDYFPTNFIVQDGLLYYVDYECNEYMDEWSFENWGIKYWSKTPEFEQYLKQHESA